MTENALQREVLESKRRLEGVMASAMDAIITVDEQLRIILFNPAAEQMFGVSTAEAIGQPISRFIPHRFREGHDEHIRRFRSTGVTGRRIGSLGAISGLRADGREFPVEASISQVDVGDQRLVTVILRDITERLANELANEEARLLLAQEVDHRAKNALAVVQALVSLTTAATKDEFIAAVRGRVAALGRAHNLLAENRWLGGDLARIATDETAAYQGQGQVKCLGSELALVPNAVQPVSLLVHELATNAVKYGALSSPTGKVVVQWRIDAAGGLEIHWSESGGPPVVEPMTQGFGSTLIATVARQLGGEIVTEWAAGGIQVTATLPNTNYRMEPLGKSPTGEAVPDKAKARTGRLLLVEDELLVGMEMANALKAEGWQVIGPAGSVEEAFELIAEGDLPDAAVLDINLNGQFVYPVADLLRTRGVPYLFCTGYETANDDERYPSVPIFHKPADLTVLIEKLRLLLDGAPAPRACAAA